MSVSGLSSGNFDVAGITYDLSVGLDQDSGTAGEVLLSGGTGRPMSWGSNSASIPKSLVKGLNIGMTTDAGDVTEFDGLVRTTISSTNTIPTATLPLAIDGDANITLNNDSTLQVIGNDLSVVKVPNTLTIIPVVGDTIVYDGSAVKSITLSDADTTYIADKGVEIDLSTTPDTIIAKVDSDAAPTLRNDYNSNELAVLRVPHNLTPNLGIEYQSGLTSYDGSAQTTIITKVDDTTPADQTISNTGGIGFDELKVLRVPNKLTAGSNITYNTGTTYDGSGAITISATDTNTEYTGTAPIDVSVSDVISLNKDGTLTTISDNLSVVKVPNTLKADGAINSTLSIGESTTGTFDGSAIKTIQVLKVPNTLTFTGYDTGTFDGSSAESINLVDTNTEYTATQPVRISAGNVISLGMDDYPDGTETIKVISNELSVARVPNKLTAGSNITFDTGSTYDGSGAITISATADTTLNLIADDGIKIVTSGNDRTISASIDTDTLQFITALGGPLPDEISVKAVPQYLTAGTGISFSTGTQYNGSTAVTISTAATGGATYLSYPHTNTFTIPYISTNPHSATSATLLALNLSGRYLASTTSISATATSYKIEISMPLNHDQSTIKGTTFYRLDKDTTGTNPYGTSNNQNGINIVVRNYNTSPSAPDNRYNGIITSEIIITGLVVGTSYAFCPAFAYHPTSGTSSSASIITGHQVGQFVITATPFSNGTIAPAPAESGDDY